MIRLLVEVWFNRDFTKKKNASAMENFHHFLNSPACSGVSITLPASS